MELLLDVLRLLVSILIAFLAGNLIAKGKLPSILGWLIAGMLLGPYALGLLGNGILDARWFEMLKSVFECTFEMCIRDRYYAGQYEESGYFAAVFKGTLLEFAIDSRETGHIVL